MSKVMAQAQRAPLGQGMGFLIMSSSFQRMGVGRIGGKIKRLSALAKMVGRHGIAEGQDEAKTAYVMRRRFRRTESGD
jgi:hypothetical protein